MVNNELIETETKEHFSKTLTSIIKISKNTNTREKVELLRTLDLDGKWDSDYGMALLSGKVSKRNITNSRCKSDNLNITPVQFYFNSILIF